MKKNKIIQHAINIIYLTILIIASSVILSTVISKYMLVNRCEKYRHSGITQVPENCIEYLMEGF